MTNTSNGTGAEIRGNQPQFPNTAAQDGKLSLQGVLVFSAFMTVFAALVLFICCCATRLSRRRQPVGAITAAALTAAQGAAAASRADSGLEPEDLQSLPVAMYSAEAHHNADCAVCLEEFADGEKVKLLPSCRHNFHVECIDLWLQSHSTCPFCRSVVKPEPHESGIV